VLPAADGEIAKERAHKVKPSKPLYAQVDGDGRLVLPPELATRYGIRPGARVLVNEGANSFNLLRPAHLAKLYIEPTNQCNLNCRTCIRNVWEEPLGKMSDTAFDRVIEGLSAFSPPPTVFFGGLGEPLYHPRIAEMVARSKELGARVEIITNGTLLTADLSRELLAAGIDMLWVSLDGATPESYADIRLGAALPQVIENIAHFRDAINAEVRGGCCGWMPKFNAQLGIEFVAMKRNIADLPAVLNLGRQLGVKRFIVTNVLPYTEEMSDETLYSGALAYNPYPHLSLPRINESEITSDPLSQAMRRMNMTWAGSNPQSAKDHCPFIESGAGAVGWDGSLSPCLPLLHSHVSFPLGRERFSRRWTIGNVTENSLADLWNTPEHIAFRERLQAFDFPPCVLCGGCELAEKNEEDCEGNVFPTCGGCLWSQGVIQCP